MRCSRRSRIHYPPAIDGHPSVPGVTHALKGTSPARTGETVEVAEIPDRRVLTTHLGPVVLQELIQRLAEDVRNALAD